MYFLLRPQKPGLLTRMQSSLIVLLLIHLLAYVPLHAISIVYNFRIAQITKQPIVEKTIERPNSIVALIFDQYRKKYSGTKQNFFGGLSSYIYDFKSYYFRTDFAVSHIKEKNDGTITFSGTETDDILFTMGHNWTISDHSVLTLSGLFGIPTHKILRLKHIDFGYSQVGLGIQFDGSHYFNHICALLYGTRYIYFVPRTAQDALCNKYHFTIGNVADFLIANKNSWKHHGFELGYSARFRFGCHCNPHFDEIVEKTNYIRSNFYFVYKYKFFIKQVSNRFLLNFSYGFDHVSKTFGNKSIITVWGSWNVRF